MDILGTPFTSTRRPGKTPFFPCSESGDKKWDLGPFLSYPSRVGLSQTAATLNVVPNSIGSSSSSAPLNSDTNPDISSLPLERQQALYTTWLYIGLIAEFLGINEVEEEETEKEKEKEKQGDDDGGKLGDSDGKSQRSRMRMVTDKEAQRALGVIYDHCVTVITNADDDDEEEEEEQEKDKGEANEGDGSRCGKKSANKFSFTYLDGMGAYKLMDGIGERLDKIGASQREVEEEEEKKKEKKEKEKKNGDEDDSEKGGQGDNVDDGDGKENAKGGKEGGNDDKDSRDSKNSDDKTVDPAKRVAYLAECLSLTSQLVSAAPQGFSPSLKLGICALAECLSFKLRHSKGFMGLGGRKPVIDFSWKKNFFVKDSAARKHMLRNGWCRSDLSRASATYGRLQTLYYLSLMDRKIAGRDHGSCGEDTGCVAGQIVDTTYRLSHDPDKEAPCSCEELEVDLAAVNDVLKDEKMNSFPVLSVEFPDDKDPGKVALKVEAAREGVEYVAISHVWADGLGNTRANTLQTCQVARLGRLVKGIEDGVNAAGDPETPPVRYRVWIDSLCVPVAPRPEDAPDPERLRIYNLALGRMKDVYIKSAHVLVLDRTLMSYESGRMHQAEILLRIFASSQWMRRLWCLQEGVFARSLYFQFLDGPVNAQAQMSSLENMAKVDFRCRHIIGDLLSEFNRLDNAIYQQRPRHHDFFLAIQSALNYRAVTVDSDEPVCIATLFGLDVAAILNARRELEPRMKLIWQMIQSEVGRLPALIIFRNDATLSGPGWGWAPRSFLRSGEVVNRTGYSSLGYIYDYTKDFVATKIPEAEIVPEKGLAVRLPGMVLEHVPLSGKPTRAWDALTSRNDEPTVYFHHESEGSWLKMTDWDAMFGGAHSETSGQPPAPSNKAGSNFSSIVEDAPGPTILIRSESSDKQVGSLCLLAHPTTTLPPSSALSSSSPPTRVRWIRKVVVNPLQPAEALMSTVLYYIAQSVAASAEGQALTQTLVAHTPSTDTGGTPAALAGGSSDERSSEIFQTTKEALKSLLKEAIDEAWTSVPGFPEAVGKSMGEGMKEFLWAAAVMRYSHTRIARNVGGEKIEEGVQWIVD